MSSAVEPVEFVGSSDLISASLVYDGGDTVTIPPQMGKPREDQMQGTPAEQLCELAGRTCYDSLGKGRPSFTRHCHTCGGDGGKVCHCGEMVDSHAQFGSCTSPRAMDCSKCGNTGKEEGYHDHIHKVGHGSVWEHFNCTIEVQFEKEPKALFPLFNRPGLYLRNDATQFARITLNPRVVTDWDAMSNVDQAADSGWNEMWKQVLSQQMHKLAPHIVPDLRKNDHWNFYGAKIVEPVYDGEAWVSLFISGSRGLSHELVRHGDFTAISQRSTRFVDESESPWVDHPLETAFVEAEIPHAPPRAREAMKAESPVVRHAREQYRSCVAVLEPWLIDRGVDKTSARKQARGVARGQLGNALYTELIFSASVAQWKRILRQRASQFADAEIREMACKALLALKQCRYRSSFENWRLEKSPDGIGFVAIEDK